MSKCSVQVQNILIKYIGHNEHTCEMCQHFKGVGAKLGSSRTRTAKGSNVLLPTVAEYLFKSNVSSLCKSVKLKKAEQKGYIWMSHEQPSEYLVLDSWKVSQ